MGIVVNGKTVSLRLRNGLLTVFTVGKDGLEAAPSAEEQAAFLSEFDRLPDLVNRHRRSIGDLEVQMYNCISGVEMLGKAVRSAEARSERVRSRIMLPFRIGWWTLKHGLSVARWGTLATAIAAIIPQTRPYVFEYIGKLMVWFSSAAQQAGSFY